MQTLELQQGARAAPVLSLPGNNLFKIRVTFVDLNNAPTNLDASPTITITDGSDNTVRVSGAPMTGPVSAGTYEYTADLTSWGDHLHQFACSGMMAGTTVIIEGAFGVYAPTAEQMLIHMVRSRLFDIEPTLYSLDLPIPKVTDDQVYLELVSAIVAINNDGIYRTSYTLANCPRVDLLVQYAWAKLLQGFAVIENWNTFNMNDGSVSLNLNRAPVFQSLGTNAEESYRKTVETWKKSMRPRLKGQGTALFPLQIRRALSFLPNMKQVFGQ